MKTFALIALLFAGPALAETVTLDGAGCGATRYCTTVPNDSNPQVGVTVDARVAYPSVTVYVGGVKYYSPSGNAPTTVAQPGQPDAPVSINYLTLTAADGSSIVLNATFNGRHILHRSGHNYWTTQWTLISGTIDR